MAYLLAPAADEPTTALLLAAAARRRESLILLTPWDDRMATAVEPLGAALLPRIGQRSLDAGLSRLRQLESLGARPLNSSQAIARAKDKLALPGTEVPTLEAVIARPNRPPPRGFPFVAKSRHGARGAGVVRIDDLDAWQALGDEPVRVERFVGPAQRSEWRVIVVRRQPLAAIARRPARGEFRANRACGGSDFALAPPIAVLDVAVAAAVAYELGGAGVDVLVPDGEPPAIIDVNDSPGLVGISTALGRDIASEWLALWLEA